MNRQTRSGFTGNSESQTDSPTKKPKKSRSISRTRKTEKKKTEDKEWKTYPRKSPSRKSPSRKSPARKTKEKMSPSPSKIISKIRAKASEIRDSITPDRRVEEVIRSSVTRFEEVTSDFVTALKRSTRLANRREASLNSKPANDNLPEKATYQENNVHLSDESKSSDEGHGFIAVVLAFVFPAAAIIGQLACTKESCAPIPPKMTITWRRFFDLEAASWYAGYFIFQLILSSLPLGFKNRSLGRSDSFFYRSNGVASLVITSAVLVGLQYYSKFPIVRILDKGLPILTTSILTSFVISVLLLIKSLRSEHRPTGGIVSNLFRGGEVNPRFGPLDVKTAILRVSLLSAIIYNSLLIFKEVQGKELGQISVNVVFAATLQIIFCLDWIIFESDFLSSFSVNYDTLGGLTLLYCAAFPFSFTLVPKYLYLSRSAHNIYIVSGAGIAFIIGYVIHRISNYQKTCFKKKPSSYPSSDIIHSRSSSLYKGGMWGRIRHPNYLGALIVHSSWSLFALTSAPLHWIPIVLLATTLIGILLQIVRVESGSQARHGSAWNIYTSQVKHKLIHKLF